MCVSSRRVRTEDVGGAVERIGQSVDVVAVVVEVEAGAGGGVDAEQAHQRLGAVVAGADADVALVEHLADVVGVDVAEREAEHAAALASTLRGPWIVMSSP